MSAAKTETRKLRVPKLASRRVRKQVRSGQSKLPSVLVLSKQTFAAFRQNRRFFITYTLLYAFLSFIFIQTISTTADITQAKELLSRNLGNAFTTSLTLYGGLIGSSTQLTNQVAALYQFIIIVVFGLALIFGLRHMYGPESQKVTLKQSLYYGMTPLIPTLLVLVVLAVQLLPLSLSSSVYATVASTGLVASATEQIGWLLLVVVLAGVSLYLVIGSILGLLIVTLPDMTPLRALRASRRLVRFRRMAVLRKLLFLPLMLLVLFGLVVVPVIAFVPAIAQLVFFVISCLALPIMLTYMYNLYRSML